MCCYVRAAHSPVAIDVFSTALVARFDVPFDRQEVRVSTLRVGAVSTVARFDAPFDRQVVRGSTLRVGCGVAKCRSVSEGVTGRPWKLAVIVACDYELSWVQAAPNIRYRAVPARRSHNTSAYMLLNFLEAAVSAKWFFNVHIISRSGEGDILPKYVTCQTRRSPTVVPPLVNDLWLL